MRGRAHAIVIGGSIAGLLAARVLSEAFERVTIVDRDELDDAPTPRKGVPQSPQVHAILTRSYEAITELFPGLAEELLAQGASIYDSGTGMAAHLNGCWMLRDRCDLTYIDCTRPLYEAKLRSRTRRLPNVAFVPRATVRTPVCDEAGTVVGVEAEDAATGAISRLEADLVVDASGRATHAPRWLAALGYGAPETEEVRVDLAYVGAMYRRAPSFQARANMYVIYPNPPTSWRGAILQRVEAGQWKLSQWGMFGDSPALDDASFLVFSQTLTSPEITDFLRESERLSEFKRMGVPTNRWHRYDRMQRFPANFFCVGDAVSSVNPIYGQGMTKAAIHAMHLRTLLREGLPTPQVAERMRQGIPALVERQAWMTTVYGDLVFPQAAGRRPADFRFVTWYTRCIGELASTDLAARRAYQAALTLRDGPYALFRPRLFAKALAYAARRRFVPFERRVNAGSMPTVD
ncbi:MAG: FAD-dependent monooxygenase [Burkholderiales bacterium]|nr:FAD-dependent monooxygenase [Burkholderiales bacterium]